MGKTFEKIDTRIESWIDKQQMFFVATAPSGDAGNINLSPKGQDTLKVIDAHTLAFMDYGGSGIETVAHLRDNGRICIMMCAFRGPPKIYRFHGQGSVITPIEPGFAELAALFDRRELGTRSIIRVDVSRISDSCGFGVPLYDFQQQRTTSVDYTRNTGTEAIREYSKLNNAESIDGLPGLSREEAESFAAPTADQPTAS